MKILYFYKFEIMEIFDYLVDDYLHHLNNQ